MKVAVIGSRTFNDYKRLKRILDLYPISKIISGNASGADTLGEKYADKKGIKKDIYPAKWDDLTTEPCIIKTNKYGKQYNALAGHNRNTDIINNCDMIIAFWDKKSKGTKDSLDKAQAQKKTTLIVYF